MPSLKNKTLPFLAMSLLGALTVSEARAGKETGNGGTVLVCGATEDPRFRNRVLLADLAEVALLPELRNRITIAESDESMDDQIQAALSKFLGLDRFDESRLGSKVYAEVLDEIRRIRESAISVSGYYWPLTSDVGPFPMPEPEDSCRLRNSVNYLAHDRIQKNPKLIARLASRTHEAALWVHEGVYSVLRKRAAETGRTVENAIPARRIVALLFARESFTELLRAMAKEYLVVQPPSDRAVELAFPEQFPTLVMPRCLADKVTHASLTLDGWHFVLGGVIPPNPSQLEAMSLPAQDRIRISMTVFGKASSCGGPAIRIEGKDYPLNAPSESRYELSIRLKSKALQERMEDYLQGRL